ncbi:F0F1 ATP synthase subunit A [Congregibacter variabilis]|uniref:ATP synthase subunit a n=1 Tax=Congregibacter variabilis TaxID=3081200 RepID=A0ABZ0I0S8_9GAMM|nr:F0F1 ATP synthase subunit A [Congregibacter sp. IMCC43200]
MTITPDSIVLWQWGALHINATMAFTWLVMLLLAVGSWLITRKLSSGPRISRWQHILEVLVLAMRDQISGITRQDSEPYLAFIGTLFIFVLTANWLIILPGYLPPTGSLSTTTALAICVFFSVPAYGVSREGPGRYFGRYLKPSPLMLPFNLIGEVSRTIALAVRLYGNVMSGTVIVAILLTLMPFFFPVLMQLLGLITGTIQAYIFSILATVYIASATAARGDEFSEQGDIQNKEPSFERESKGEPHGKP